MSKETKEIIAIGLMSGTSMDGINVSLVKTNGINLKQSNFSLIERYSDITFNLLNKITNNLTNSVKDITLLKKTSELVTIDHYNAIKLLLKKTKLKPEIIGFHGQTIYHNPNEKISIQLGDPKLLSKMLKTNVVGNFRKKDIENGGEGAPIAPIYHKHIIEKLNIDLPCGFINIGGVSNISYWNGKELIGFDTGPGNALMDIYMQEQFQTKYDDQGKLAANGKIIHKTLNQFLKDKYFCRKYPKSLDKLYFIKILEILKGNNHKPENIMATLAAFTINSIMQSISILPTKPKVIYLMGGGIKNKTIINGIKSKFDNDVIISNDVGINGEMVEAELIAYLAVRKLYDLPSSFPETTGVKKPVCLGDLFTKNN
jgi:anhydro-N-acetylmuramic acid kinase